MTNETREAQSLPLPQGFDNSEQTPQLKAPLHSLRHDEKRENIIPPHEQDHDAGRFVDPRDGQAVVDLLNQPPGDQASPDDIGTSATSQSVHEFPRGVFYGDLRQRAREPASEAENRYGRSLDDTATTTVSSDGDFDWTRWDLQSSGYRSQRQNAQPAPGLH